MDKKVALGNPKMMEYVKAEITSEMKAEANILSKTRQNSFLFGNR